MTIETKIYSNYPSEAVVIEQKIIMPTCTKTNIVFMEAHEVPDMIKQMIDALAGFYQHI